MTDPQLPPARSAIPKPVSDYPANASAPGSISEGRQSQSFEEQPGSERPIPSKEKNTIGLVAFIIAAVGFVFACIPGALVVGWVLLPIAFILSIVGLILPRKKRAFALTALIVAVVGTIVGVVVFFAVVASSFNDAFGDLDPSVAPPEASEPVDAEPEAAEGAASASGTRDNPAAIGSTITGSEYTVVINSVNLNATDQVLGANQFNEAPPAGASYALVNATITYTGAESGFAAFVGIDYVASTGEVVTSADSFAVAPDPTLGLDELYNGGVATGNVVLAVPAGDPGSIRVRPGMIDDEVFVAVQ